MLAAAFLFGKGLKIVQQWFELIRRQVIQFIVASVLNSISIVEPWTQTTLGLGDKYCSMLIKKATVTLLQCCGSESEWIRKFWLDPNTNPKKSSDSDPDTVVEWKILWKNADQTLEREKNYVFLLENLFLWRTGSRTRMKAIRHPFGKIWGQNISLRIRIRKKIVDPKKMNSDPQHCFIVSVGKVFLL
jgi:hypothetical protein